MATYADLRRWPVEKAMCVGATRVRKYCGSEGYIPARRRKHEELRFMSATGFGFARAERDVDVARVNV